MNIQLDVERLAAQNKALKQALQECVTYGAANCFVNPSIPGLTRRIQAINDTVLAAVKASQPISTD